jgi:hypothetical protein
MEKVNWVITYIVTYYDIENDVIDTEIIIDRTEHEAEREAIGLMPFECEDWTLTKIEDNES